jgi:hypothetical protein
VKRSSPASPANRRSLGVARARYRGRDGNKESSSSGNSRLPLSSPDGASARRAAHTNSSGRVTSPRRDHRQRDLTMSPCRAIKGGIRK